MKRWLLVSLVFTGVFPLHARNLTQYFLLWTRTLYYVNPHGLGIDSQDNVYIGYSDTTSTYFLRKINSSGSYLWIDTVDISFSHLYTTSDGTIYTAGNLTPSEWVLSIWNSEGTKLWQDTVYTPFDTCTLGWLQVNAWHEVFLAGLSDNNVLWIAECDSTGNIVDTARIIPDSTWEGVDMAFDSAGNIYILSSFQKNDSTSRWITEKYDKYGHLMWSNYADFNDAHRDHIHVSNSYAYISGNKPSGLHEGWIFVLKYDKKTGVLVDSFAFYLYSGLPVYSVITADSTGNIYIGGSIFSPIPHWHIEGFMGKLNPQGETVWDNEPCGGTVEQLSVDEHSNIYALFWVPDDTNKWHVSILRYTYTGDVEERRNENSDMIINAPAIERGDINLTYSVRRPEEYSIEVYSVDGRCIRRVLDNRPGTHYFAVNNLKNGIYFVRLQQKRESVTRKIIVER